MYGEYQQTIRRSSESKKVVGKKSYRSSSSPPQSDAPSGCDGGAIMLRAHAAPHFAASRSLSAQTVIEQQRPEDDENDERDEEDASLHDASCNAGSSKNTGSLGSGIEWKAIISDDGTVDNDMDDSTHPIDESLQSTDTDRRRNVFDINDSGNDNENRPKNNFDFLLINSNGQECDLINTEQNGGTHRKLDGNSLTNSFHVHNHALAGAARCGALCVIRGASNLVNTMCIRGDNSDPGDNEADDELAGAQLARAHWMQLHKLNLQSRVIQRMFIHLLRRYPDLRPVWQFAWEIRDFDQHDWYVDLAANHLFRGQCTSYQAVITLIMDNADESSALAHLLRELGAHHFYYDAIETHFDMMRDAFLCALIDTAEPEVFDTELLDAWDEFWIIISERMGEGIARQRADYLAQCVTPSEMAIVQRTWQRLRTHGLTDVGATVVATAAKTFADLWRKFHVADSIEGAHAIEQAARYFDSFCTTMLARYDTTLSAYTPDTGFVALVECMHEKEQHGNNGGCQLGVIVTLGPSLVRRAFMDGFVAMLSALCGPLTDDLPATRRESLVHIWGKIYRVHEQAIISNEMSQRHCDVSSL